MVSLYVKNLIQKAYEEKASVLNLGNCGLIDIPEDLLILAPFLEILVLGDQPYEKTTYNKNNSYKESNNFKKGVNSFNLLTKFKKLHTLSLYNTKIESHFLSLEIFSLIKVLDLSCNKIGDHGATQLSQLSNLIELNVSRSYIDDNGAKALSKLVNLHSLKIGYNYISAIGAKSISKLSNLYKLDICSNQLCDSGSQHISDLKELVFLNIASNKISDVGVKEYFKLDNLNSLMIYNNSLTKTGANYLSKITKLKELNISTNQIGSLGATSIANMVNLSSLKISSNQIGDGGARNISKLINLKYLDVYNNQISKKGVFYLSKLPHLSTLNISNNHLGDSGAVFIAKFRSLENLIIYNNKIKKLESIGAIILQTKLLNKIEYDYSEISGMPMGIAGDIQALKAYFSSTERIENTLVKLILIGNTTAGKSSLADFLANNKYEENRESTHGIKTWRWRTGSQKNDLQVNIWDFGGQDYYHLTHNIFLKDRTFFLLLHTNLESHLDQKNSDENQYLQQNYWLGNIRSLTNKESKIWYIQSKSDSEKLKHLDTHLVERYSVSSQFKISVKQAYKKEPNALIDFEYFRNNLLAELESISKTLLPASWVVIRDDHLPEWRKTEIYLTKDDFKFRCEQALKDKSYLLHDLQISWAALLPYLKGCGEIVEFEMSALKDKIFLSAQNLTKGIFDILSKKAYANKGEFSLNDLDDLSRKNGSVYLNILLSFELIFKKPGSTDIYVAPQYLPKNQYANEFQELLKLSFVLSFPDFMPWSLTARFLVSHATQFEGSHYWYYGALIKLHGSKVFVRIDPKHQKVYVHIEESINRLTVAKELFVFFISLIDEVLFNEEYTYKATDAGNSKELALSINGLDFSAIRNLEEAVELETFKTKSIQGGIIKFNDVLHSLFNNKRMPKRIFLSYSHKDEAYKIELDNHFAALKRSYKIETWQDRKIVAGSDWDKSIEEALFNSDLALLLLSPDFMASDYIWNVEIPKAVANGIKIIPIFVRPCDFKESIFELYIKQGLPSDTRWIVSSKVQYRDEAYLEVVDGIQRLL